MKPYDPPAKNFPDVVTVETAVAMKEPLMVDAATNTKETMLMEAKKESLQGTKTYSLIIGLIIGSFIQFSALGANFLMTTMYDGGYEVFYTKQFVVISTIFCFVTSIMGVLVLLFLRSLVVTSFYAVTKTPNNDMEKESFQRKEKFVAGLIQNMEYYFAIGSIIGVCVCWTITDGLLGMKNNVEYGLLILATSLVWCRVAMVYCSRSTEEM